MILSLIWQFFNKEKSWQNLKFALMLNQIFLPGKINNAVAKTVTGKYSKKEYKEP